MRRAIQLAGLGIAAIGVIGVETSGGHHYAWSVVTAGIGTVIVFLSHARIRIVRRP